MTITKAYFQLVDGSTTPADTSVVLIGAALDGPVKEPFMIPAGTDPITVLGDSPLAAAYKQTYAAGASNIVLYRVNGTYAEAYVPLQGTNLFYFRSVGASDLYNTLTDTGSYNNIKVLMDGTGITITSVSGLTRAYLFSDYLTAQALVDQVNLDAAYGLIEVEATALQPSAYLNTITDDDLFTAFFEGGSTESTLIPDRSSGTDISSTIAELKSRLKEALFSDDPDDQLAGDPNGAIGLLDFNHIGIVDMFYDDDPDFSLILGLFCYNRSILGQGCLAVMGTQPLFDTTRITEVRDRLMKLSPASLYGGSVSDGSTGVQDIMPISFVQIVVGDTLVASSPMATAVPVSLAYSYLGIQATTSYYKNLTNKSLTGVTNLNYEFTKEVVDNFLANGYISIVSSIRRGFVPYTAITAVGGKSSTSYKNPHYVRISQTISRMLSTNLDSLVGQPLSKSTQNSLSSKVRTLIQPLVDNGIIRNFTVSCEFIGPTYAEARVQVSFTPYSDVTTVSSVTVIPYNQG